MEEKRTDIGEPSNAPYKSFIFYASMRESIEALPKKQGDELLRVIMVYGTSGETCDCSNNVKSAFLSMKPNIDAAHKKFDKRAEFLEKRKNDEERVSDNNIKEKIESYVENEYKAKDADQIISLARGEELRDYHKNGGQDDNHRSR